MDGIAGIGGSMQAMAVPMSMSMMSSSSSLAIISTGDDDDENKTIIIAASQQQSMYTATGGLASSLSSAFTCGASLDVMA